MSVKGFFFALLRVADSIDFGLVLNPYAPMARNDRRAR
ncbi:hypothetical protein ABIE63_002701 [Limibacillus sp. MBR-115]